MSERVRETAPARAQRSGAERGAPPLGQRRTKQRAAITALMSDNDDFRSAQQIHDALRDAGESVGLTTVYRTLQAMVQAGEVDVIRTDEEQLYRRCATSTHHHHLVCRQCGRTVEISGPEVEQWADGIARRHGFREVGHQLEVFGLCNDC